MPQRSSRAQLALLDVEPHPLSLAAHAVEPAQGAPETDREQLDLFAERARLARELDAALRLGDFLRASEIRRQFEDTHGALEDSRALDLVDRLAPQLASPLPKVAVPAWGEVALELRPYPRLRRLVTDGVLGRLAESHMASALLSHDAGILPELAEIVRRRAPDGTFEARSLVRDALLAGRPLDPRDFAWDESVADLLAEDEEPRWLACLGLIHRLWSAPQPAAPDLDAVRQAFAMPGSQEDAALAFWSCLLVAGHSGDDEATLHEARRRLKRLRPAYHALYMRRVRPRDT
jgi:hypothetical protein